MKKSAIIISAIACVMLSSCSAKQQESKTEDEGLKTDSVNKPIEEVVETIAESEIEIIDSLRADLNYDGIEDFAAITHSEGEDCNCLQISFGQSDGTMTLARDVREMLVASDEYIHYSYSLSINSGGSMVISCSEFASAGSYDSGSYSQVYRYIDDDFYLIGQSFDGFSRSTGDGTKYSYNYRSHKMSKTTYNVFDESEGKMTKWSDLPNRPLVRLGILSLLDMPEGIE